MTVRAFVASRRLSIWLWIATLAFGLRFLAAFLLNAFSHPELFEYENLARSLVSGRGFVYSHLGIPYYSYAPPLYAWICAGIYVTGGSVTVVLLVQMLVSSAHAVLVGRLAQRLFTETAGVIAGALMALHPGLIIYSSLKAHPLTFDAFFFTAILWQFLKLRDQPTAMRSVLTGVTIGLGILSRGTALVFLVVGAAWLVLTGAREQRKLILKRIVVTSICALLVVAPWVVRNTLVQKQFVFLVTTDSEVFWRGNNPAATGHSYIDANRIVLDQLTPSAKAELYSLSSEIQQAHWFRERAMNFIRDEPSAFLRLTVRKFVLFWWFAQQTGVRYPGLWRLGYEAYYVPVVCLAFVSLVIAARGSAFLRRDMALLGLFLVSLSALQSLYYVEGRHRWAVEPFVLVLAGGGAAGLIGRSHGRSGSCSTHAGYTEASL